MAKNIDVNTLSYGELTAMGWCAMAGDVRRLCMLAEKGGDIDGHLHNGWRPIHVAISSNREDCVHQLLERGCNPNAPGQNGLTACHLACVAGSFGGLGILIENGADPFIEADNGRTAIYYASESGNRKCVRMLISLKRFIPNHTDHFGMTPLHICRNIECASILLSSGVDPRQADIEGRRAWQTVPIQEVREYLMASVYAKRKPAPPWGKF
jgi:ankyrin repeat protein